MTANAQPGARARASAICASEMLMPVIFFYSGWSYWVFRGKVRADVGYH